jgi:hypothetical protein
MLQSGHQFGRLTLQELMPSPPKQWRCQCTCGASVTVRQNNLLTGHTRSCGCLQRELRAQRQPWQRHGATANGQRPPEYRAWQKLRRKYQVCARWQHSYPAFFADIGPRPSPRHVLVCFAKQRIAGPKTVRWLPKSDAPRRTVTKLLPIGREAHTVRAWAKQVGLSHATIYKRLAQGWSAREAVFTRSHQERPLC